MHFSAKPGNTETNEHPGNDTAKKYRSELDTKKAFADICRPEITL